MEGVVHIVDEEVGQKKKGELRPIWESSIEPSPSCSNAKALEA